MDQPHTFIGVHDGVPNLKPGVSDTFKWVVMLIVALAGLFGPTIKELIRAPREDDMTKTRETMEAVQREVAALKEAARSQVELDAEREKRRALEYSSLKELIQNGRGHRQ